MKVSKPSPNSSWVGEHAGTAVASTLYTGYRETSSSTKYIPSRPLLVICDFAKLAVLFRMGVTSKTARSAGRTSVPNPRHGHCELRATPHHRRSSNYAWQLPIPILYVEILATCVSSGQGTGGFESETLAAMAAMAMEWCSGNGRFSRKRLACVLSLSGYLMLDASRVELQNHQISAVPVCPA